MKDGIREDLTPEMEWHSEELLKAATGFAEMFNRMAALRLQLLKKMLAMASDEDLEAFDQRHLNHLRMGGSE